MEEMNVTELLYNAMVVIAEKCESKEEILKAFKAVKEGLVDEGTGRNDESSVQKLD